MKNEKNHIDPKHLLDEIDELLFEQAQVKFNKDKSEVLALIMAKKLSKKPLKFAAWRIAAAIAFLLVSSLVFMRYYSKSHTTAQYEIADLLLPDGSKVKLNQSSVLSYKPYWWFVNRTIVFEGEAFFEVEKGSTFTVNSQNGTTTVLGTSFNINSRNNGYQVFCKTGKVLVKNKSSEIILIPNQWANTQADGTLVKTEVKNENLILWTNGLLNFNNTPLSDVINQFENIYNIKIKTTRKVDLYDTYSGIFTRPDTAIEALSIICLSLDLDFDQLGPNEFEIFKP